MASAVELLEKLRPKLEAYAARKEELTQQVSDPEVLGQPQRYATFARELGRITKIVERYEQLQGLESQLVETQALLSDPDPEMREMAESEAATLTSQRDELVSSLMQDLVLGDEVSERNAIIEIRAGTGGEEAKLFAGDVLKMYLKFCELRGYKVEILDSQETELGGYKEIVIRVAGDGVYRDFRYESGTHRVQRVPATESQGRIHTSTCTVAVMPEAEEVDVEVKEADYERQTYCAGGAGGQHVNRTESAVRLIHHETGIVVTCQDERSQHKNFARAMQILRARLFDHYQREAEQERADSRKKQIGRGDRSEKIRTYNWPQNRVTDHRLGKNYSLEQIVAGELDKVIADLQDFDTQQRIEALEATA